MQHPTLTQITKKNLLRILCGLLALASLVFVAAWPFSFRYYTTLGIDMDRLDGPDLVCYRYYRLRWPGDGSFRIGGGSEHYTQGTKVLEPFDWGGRFLQPRRTEPARSLGNRLGFWWVDAHWDDPWTRTKQTLEKPWQFWIGVPSFLPALVCIMLAWICWRSARRSKDRLPHTIGTGLPKAHP